MGLATSGSVLLDRFPRDCLFSLSRSMSAFAQRTLVAIRTAWPAATVMAVGMCLSAALALQQQRALERIEIGRASCRERGEISVVAVSLKKKKQNRDERKRDVMKW